MASDGFFAMGDSSQKAFQSDEKRVDGNKENGFVNRLFFFLSEPMLDWLSLIHQVYEVILSY